MAINFLQGLQIGVPGVYTFKTESDTRPIDILPYRNLYMLGFSAVAEMDTINNVTRISSFDDFENVFPNSISSPSVKGFFENSEGFGNFYFVNVGIPKTYEIEIKDGGTPGIVTPGSYTITLHGVVKTLVVAANTTRSEAASNLVNLINADTVLNKEVTALPGGAVGVVLIRVKNPKQNALSSLSVGSPLITVITIATPTVPTALNYVYSIQTVFDTNLENGFLNAPEAFMTFGTSDRLSIQIALENLISSYGFQWSGLIDPGNPTQIFNADRALAERKTYNSVEGHCSYYYPYLLNLADQLVPPSAFIAGIAINRFVKESIAEPPAGVRYPLKGVKSLKYTVNWAEQNVLNPAGVNCIVYKPNYGIVVWGARSMAPPESLVTFTSTRVILNVAINSINQGFDEYVFKAIGSQGTQFVDIQRKAIAVLDLMWRAGLLYGASSSDAYGVISDGTVQVPSLLQDGLALVFIWLVPATLTERLIIAIKQTEIGGLQAVMASDLSLLTSQVASNTADQSTPTP